LAERIRQAIVEAEQDAPKAVERDYAPAIAFVGAMAKDGTLSDEVVLGFAKDGQFENTVVALSALAELSIDAAARLFAGEPTDTVLIVAKAVGLTWATAKCLLLLRTSGRSASPGDLESARLNFVRLGPTTAKQGLQRYKTRAKQS
jgi:hypothetical protein